MEDAKVPIAQTIDVPHQEVKAPEPPPPAGNASPAAAAASAAPLPPAATPAAKSAGKPVPQAMALPRPIGIAPDLDPHIWVNKVFGPIFKRRNLWMMGQGEQYFVCTHPDDTIFFGVFSPLKSEERYDWYIVATNPSGPFMLGEQVASFLDAPKAIKFGFLRDPDKIPPPAISVQEVFEKERLAMVDVMRGKAQRFFELEDIRLKSKLDSSQTAEHEQLKKELL